MHAQYQHQVLFEFVHNILLSYAGSNKFVSLPKFRVMSAVMEQVDINWARLPINLFIEQTTLISRSFDGDQLVKIEARQILHHGM